MEEKQQWQVVDGICETQGGEGQRVYGVCVKCGGVVLAQWTDVADNREAAAHLARLLQQTCPESCHWDAIVEDYTHSLY